LWYDEPDGRKENPLMKMLFGSKFCSIIIGAFAFMTVEPARPPRIASKIFWGSTPHI